MPIFHEKIHILDKKIENSTSFIKKKKEKKGAFGETLSKIGCELLKKTKKRSLGDSKKNQNKTKQKKKGGGVNEPESKFKNGINVVNNYPRHQF